MIKSNSRTFLYKEKYKVKHCPAQDNHRLASKKQSRGCWRVLRTKKNIEDFKQKTIEENQEKLFMHHAEKGHYLKNYTFHFTKL